MLTSFLAPEELQRVGFGYLGRDAKISRKASFYNPLKLSIGDFSRIDDYCVLSAGEGGIEIGRNVHIAIYTSLIGRGKIKIGNFSNLSSQIMVYSSNDDYSGEFMTNPTVDSHYTNAYSAPVTIGDNVIILSGCVSLTGVKLEEGVSIGALSLVNKDCEAFKFYAGVPARYLKDRCQNLLKLAADLPDKESHTDGP
jgi:galactoside O-acetyltransferase